MLMILPVSTASFMTEDAESIRTKRLTAKYSDAGTNHRNQGPDCLKG